jgi:hypothetical protein
MKSNNFVKFPLSLLRSGRSEVSATIAIFCTAVRNVGIGFRSTREEREFDALLDKGLDVWDDGEFSMDENDYEAITVGSELLGLESLPGQTIISEALCEADSLPEVPFVTLKMDFLKALLLALHLQDWLGKPEGKSARRVLSWREFRVLCAIISAKPNRKNFCFLGWETIAARASGFTTKTEARKRAASLPEHAQLLSRSQICTTLKRLEALRFFMRFNYSRGARGGYSAYSIRHSTREQLAESVIDWADYNNVTVSENRQADQELCRKLSPRNTR